MSERNAMNQALFYLGKAARTTKQVREYLQKKGHDEEIIEATLTRIVEYGYLDDEDYAESYVRSHGSLRGGRRKLQGALLQKGVARETVEQAVALLSDEDELQGALGWIRKWERQFEGLPARQKRDRIYQRLAGRGYDWAVIQKALRETEMCDVEDNYLGE